MLMLITGAPNSIIGMSAVDRAAYFLYDESRLTRDSAFKKLNDYDMGCVREGGRNGQHVFEASECEDFNCKH